MGERENGRKVHRDEGIKELRRKKFCLKFPSWENLP
jgi:hypothetical protein